RRLPLDNCVFGDYRNTFKSKVVEACSVIRNLVLRAKLFVNYYVSKNATLAEPKCIKCIFTQNFWYSMIQLVNGQRPKNSRLISQQLLSSFDSFKTTYPKIVFPVKLFPGLSQAITEACTEIATSYTNSIVENFEEKLLYFLIYKIQTAFVCMPWKLVKKVTSDFCYQEICQGKPKWPTDDYLTKDIKAKIQTFCEPWKKKLGKKVNMKTLSADPGSFVPFLLSLNAEFEREHDDHKPFDVRRRPLPKLLSLLPKVSVQWRFITLSVNALSSFVKRSLPRNYQSQLELFFNVFDFKKLRYKR
ncbi:hypothetical protein BDF20DRAFT_928839, partial [Mycotypha africana]|uniref:uncharacterized protein n=1 Tax=Mycotypha africana TaxID=64632 RepID=UPI0023010AAE